MMIALEIFGAVAAALTIFSAGVAVGRIIERKNDRQQRPNCGSHFMITYEWG